MLQQQKRVFAFLKLNDVIKALSTALNSMTTLLHVIMQQRHVTSWDEGIWQVVSLPLQSHKLFFDGVDTHYWSTEDKCAVTGV